MPKMFNKLVLTKKTIGIKLKHVPTEKNNTKTVLQNNIAQIIG
jgi:hypothetical protein